MCIWIREELSGMKLQANRFDTAFDIDTGTEIWLQDNQILMKIKSDLF